MGFLPTLARQRAWYPEVYNRPELYRCVKCGDEWETQDHIYECADHLAVVECFEVKYRVVQPRVDRRMVAGALRPWTSMGWLQGRTNPQWKAMIPMLRHGRRLESTAAVIRQLLRACLETWYHGTLWCTASHDRHAAVISSLDTRNGRLINAQSTHVSPGLRVRLRLRPTISLCGDLPLRGIWSRFCLSLLFIPSDSVSGSILSLAPLFKGSLSLTCSDVEIRSLVSLLRAAC